MSTSTWDEALFFCSASRAFPSSLSKLERRLDSLHATQGGPEIPITTRDERRVSHHKSRRAPCFPLHMEMRAHSLLQLKRNPNFPLHRKRRPVSPIKSRVETRGSCCKEKGLRVPPPLQISPDSTALAPMEHRVSPHKRMGDLSPMLILLKKPKFKAWTQPEAWHPFDNLRGMQSSMPQPDEAWLPSWTLMGSPRSLSSPERNTEFPEWTLDTALFTCSDSKGIPTCPSQLEKRPDFSEATRADPGGPCRKSRGIPSFLPQLEKNHKILPSMRDEALFQSSVSREMPRSLWKHERVLDTLDATQEGPRDTRPHSRGTPSFPEHLNLSPFATRFPCFLWKGIPTFPSSLKRRLASQWNSSGTLVGCATIPKTLISPSTQDKAWCPCTNSNGTPSIKSEHEGPLTLRLHPPEKDSGSKSNWARGLTPHSQLKRQAEFSASTQDEAHLPCSNSTETLRSMSEI